MDNCMCIFEWTFSRVRKCGAIEWLLRSSDLSLCNFSMWRIMKDKVFTTKLRDLQYLNEMIVHQFENVFDTNGDLYDRICKSVAKHC